MGNQHAAAHSGNDWLYGRERLRESSGGLCSLTWDVARRWTRSHWWPPWTLGAVGWRLPGRYRRSSPCRSQSPYGNTRSRSVPEPAHGGDSPARPTCKRSTRSRPTGRCLERGEPLQDICRGRNGRLECARRRAEALGLNSQATFGAVALHSGTAERVQGTALKPLRTDSQSGGLGQMPRRCRVARAGARPQPPAVRIVRCASPRPRSVSASDLLRDVGRVAAAAGQGIERFRVPFRGSRPGRVSANSPSARWCHAHCGGFVAACMAPSYLNGGAALRRNCINAGGLRRPW
jgi:hypothetical protein